MCVCVSMNLVNSNQQYTQSSYADDNVFHTKQKNP